MKKLLLLLFLLPFMAKTQCDNGTNYYPTSIYTPSVDTWDYASSCNWAGEVIQVNIVSGDSYQFSTCDNYGGVLASYDTQITLRDGSGNVLDFNDDYFGCSGFSSYINWTATYTGVLYVHLNEYNCATNMTCTRVMIYRSEPQLNPGPCTNSNSYTTTNMPVQTSPSSTIPCYYAGEYSRWAGSESGISYIVSSSNSNDWITVRSSTFDGPVEVVGTTPLVLTASSDDESYFIHVNTNDLCGTESTCRDITVTRQSALPITLNDFDAFLSSGIKKYVVIEWSTHSEQNNDYFTIYKSYDGYTWSKLIEVDGAGNSNTLLNYSATDENPKPGTQYYKLRQTDYDGNYEDFNVVSIELKTARLEVIKAYNQMGQEVNLDTKGLLFLEWDNGDITKTFNP